MNSSNTSKAIDRVTPADIEAEIDVEFYFTGSDGIDGAERSASGLHAVLHIGPGYDGARLGLLTICILRLRNGFTVVGHSACVDPAAFDADIGRRVARENAIEQLWPLLGFRLMDRIQALKNGPTVSLGLASAAMSAVNFSASAPGPSGSPGCGHADSNGPNMPNPDSRCAQGDQPVSSAAEPLSMSAAILDAATKVRETAEVLRRAREDLAAFKDQRERYILYRDIAVEKHEEAVKALRVAAGEVSDYGN